MGEARKEALRVGFDGSLKLQFHGPAITSDAGLVAYRELDETLGLTATADDVFCDPRRGKNTPNEVTALLPQSVYSRLAGYDDTNVAERLAVHPAMRQVVGGRAKDHQAASTSQMGRFETEILTARRNRKALMDLSAMWIDRVRQRRALDKLILDLDIRRYYRGDSAFAIPELYSFLEGENYGYVIRLKSNLLLERFIQHLMTRPVGRPPKKPIGRYHDFMYQVASWDNARRVVAKVEWHQGELFPRVGFIVTNLPWRRQRVVRFYDHRGTAEQWIKDGKNAVKWTRLSCHDFVDNQVRLEFFALAYNLGNLLRRLALPGSVKHWSMTCCGTFKPSSDMWPRSKNRRHCPHSAKSRTPWKPDATHCGQSWKASRRGLNRNSPAWSTT